MKTEKFNYYTLDEVIDSRVGKRGTEQREQFEYDLQMGIMGSMIRKARMKRNLTQSELGRLVGVQRAQISRIENSLNSASINTLSRIFKALDADVTFSVRVDGEKM